MSVNIDVLVPPELLLHHISGTMHFINEYVVVKEIPITRLLYAFGICLVRTAPGLCRLAVAIAS